MTDIDLKLEYYRIRAWMYVEKHGTLPEDNPYEVYGETDTFDDIVELLNSGLLEEDKFWEDITKASPVLPR